jgi:hypothetical protein
MEIGQIVLYHPPGGQSYFGRELSAIVTQVHAESVNLCIFDPYGNPIQNPPQNIPIEKNEFNGGYCSAVTGIVPVRPQPFGGMSTPDMAPQPSGGQPAGDPYAGSSVKGMAESRQQVASELPAGATLVEHRAATPEEVSKAKAGMKMPSTIKNKPRKSTRKPGK